MGDFERQSLGGNIYPFSRVRSYSQHSSVALMDTSLIGNMNVLFKIS